VNDEGSVWDVTVIRAGLSLNGNYYPDKVLREAVPLFEGARVFVKSDAEHLKGGGKDVRNIAGWLTGAKFVEGKAADTGRVTAQLTSPPPCRHPHPRRRRLEARQARPGRPLDRRRRQGHHRHARRPKVREAQRITKVSPWI
jgi:hypothetical protein